MRGLIALVLVIGAGLGWIVRSARIQREAVAAIEEDGGGAYYHWNWMKGSSNPGGEPWAPRWVVDLIGADYFGHVTAVWLSQNSVASDAVMEKAGRLTRIQRLGLDRSSISDTGLAHLKGLTELSDLSLSGTRVTDAGLAHLAGLTRLLRLDLERTRISGAGLAWIPTGKKTANGITGLPACFSL